MGSTTTDAMQTGTPDKQTAVSSPRITEQARATPRYHVILLDDDDHTYEYVIDMLRKLFGLDKDEAYEVACEVDTTGRVILETTTRERAEFKRDQIHSFGRDWRLARCAGCMTSLVEPAV